MVMVVVGIAVARSVAISSLVGWLTTLMLLNKRKGLKERKKRVVNKRNTLFTFEGTSKRRDCVWERERWWCCCCTWGNIAHSSQALGVQSNLYWLCNSSVAVMDTNVWLVYYLERLFCHHCMGFAYNVYRILCYLRSFHLSQGNSNVSPRVVLEHIHCFYIEKSIVSYCMR